MIMLPDHGIKILNDLLSIMEWKMKELSKGEWSGRGSEWADGYVDAILFFTKQIQELNDIRILETMNELHAALRSPLKK